MEKTITVNFSKTSDKAGRIYLIADRLNVAWRIAPHAAYLLANEIYMIYDNGETSLRIEKRAALVLAAAAAKEMAAGVETLKK